MIWFQLGREQKLSIAELLAVFPNKEIAFFSSDFLILDGLEIEYVLKVANNLWWTIKIVEIIDENILDIAKNSGWKFKYWLSTFWEKKNLKSILIWLKKDLKLSNISSRFVNKDFTNLSSSQILGENLIKSGTDFSYIFAKVPSTSILIKEENIGKYYIWKTIWIQDIYNYSKRDYEKDRDMQTGMLPPKLSQMMINIAKSDLDWQPIIYDPFVWLGTVLIEAILMWFKSVYWSDLNEKMVENTMNNITTFCKTENIEFENFQVIKLNAKFINESEYFQKWVNLIVTEWYLWEMMTQKNISLERIDKQKKSLLELYTSFFEWLEKVKYKWNIVICFPLWEMNWKYIYFNEIYDLLVKYSIIQDIFPPSFTWITTSKSWSLIYKRDKQLVWREIFKLKLKKV